MTLFNHGWLFAKETATDFTPVNLPHDWLISDTNNLYQSNIGWYKRELDTSFLKENQKLFIRFDGVYMDSALYVNDKKAGEWKYGYTAFEINITDYLQKDGKNTLLLRVDYKSPSERWYTGAGIYRDVFLKVKNACHFVSDGIYVTTGRRDGQWYIEVDAETETGGTPYELRHSIYTPDGILAADCGAQMLMPEVEVWDVQRPFLYRLHSELIVDGQVADEEDTQFGFREIIYTTGNGFYLNGRRLKLNGVCLHHDLGSLGAAVHRGAIRRQLSLFKDMGVNALRTAHNPPAKIFMELADELGFMVMSEIFDVWKRPKTQYDYSRFFDEWVEKDVESWLRRDRNHPSVIMWSIGNEIYDTHADAHDGAKTIHRIVDMIEKYDPKKHAHPTLCSNYMLWENTQKCADILNLVGYNYAERLYQAHHKEHPNWVIYGSETCATVQSRGIYHFPLSKSILADDDLQCSALGNSATSWGAKNIEECILKDRGIPFSLGQFIWVGQDHLGEPTPYHTKNSYMGHVDTAGFPKDSYYMFKAAWTDYKEDPMIHLFPYWDFSPGQQIDVRICTNAPSVQLYFNGESLGHREGKFVYDWQLPYSPGELQACAYNEEGELIASTIKKSFGEASELSLESEIHDGLLFVTISAVDKDGNLVENSNRRVNVSVKNAVLLGLDNGDPTDFEQYQSTSRRLFSGKLLAIAALIKNPDLPPEEVIQNTGECEYLKYQFSAALDETDIPIRKIELTRDGYTVKAKILPENATYDDLHWRLTDAGGIDSVLGTLEPSPDGKSAVITPKGDGELFVRCATKNGREHINLISQISLNVSGVGKLYLNPYSFVSAGLYGYSNAELTNGNERGVATLRNGESHVGFKDLDFGRYGSDELILPLFALSGDPFTFEIWEGIPAEGGDMLCEVLYDKGTIWNTYQEIVCKLPRRLRGISTLCLVFRQKVHIKGFRFVEYNKAFQKLMAAENDVIYGDTFTINGNYVENIGNNVSLVFEDMDFSSAGTDSISLCWRSKIEKNSVLFMFDNKDSGTSEIREMIEITEKSDYSEQVFKFKQRIYGKNTVSMIFLPGCNLDLAWIHFM